MRTIVLGLFVGGTCLFACADTRSEPSSLATSEEKAAEATLRERTGVAWTVRQDAVLHTAAFVAPPRGAGPRVTAKAFLAANKDVLKLRAPDEELVVTRTDVDDLAMTHVRMQQVERGVPVTGGNVRVHFDGEGRLTSLEQHYVPALAALDLTPAVTRDAALATATTALQARRGGAEGGAEVSVLGDARLVVDGYGVATPALAWEFDLRAGDRGAWRVLVDAHDGTVRLMFDRVTSIEGTGRGILGQERKIEFSVQNGRNVLVDTTRAAVIRTLDARQSPNVQSARVVTSNSATSWDTADRRAPGAAVDSHFFTALSTDFFANTLGYRGWDGKGGEQRVFTHVGDDQDGQPGWDNATFDPITNAVSFGDGRDFFNPFASSMDVVAHEFTHAVTNFTSGLIYLNQSGALNESISDVFGAVVEHSFAPDAVKNWHLGEGIPKGSDLPMRDMDKPESVSQPQPSHMSQFQQLSVEEDNGGVHVNSGIPNKAAQLMTVGGTHHVSKVTVAGKGIGWDNLAKVWHRANTTYLSESSDFAAMAKATLQAAADLKLGEDDVNTIDCAWKAVGVAQGTCIAPKTVDPTPTEVDPEATPLETKPGDESTPKKTKPKKKKTVEEDDEEEEEAIPAPRGCSTTPTKTDAPWSALLALFGLSLFLRRRARR
ncbi:MAG: M4 family metallopeptidase [Labilithrix sp.]|nr:M4 family metallopeptidase [Labilithrix sp.]MCW5815198.1 M4 family metallopeptidase [Labilithrix sp.]